MRGGHGEEPVNSKYEDDESTAPADPDKQMQRGVFVEMIFEFSRA